MALNKTTRGGRPHIHLGQRHSRHQTHERHGVVKSSRGGFLVLDVVHVVLQTSSREMILLNGRLCVPSDYSHPMRGTVDGPVGHMSDVPDTRDMSSTLEMNLDVAPIVHAAGEQVIWATGVAIFLAEATPLLQQLLRHFENDTKNWGWEDAPFKAMLLAVKEY